MLTVGGKQQALDDFTAAGKLAPHNGLIAYFTAKSLLELRRRSDAEPYLRKAAQNGKGSWIKEVQDLLAGYPRE
ncbi:MAG: hypothetical protein LC772_04735 [Chloroflexi bacterium]|nr:hypothetical protein [Chloroflexota bacterium]